MSEQAATGTQQQPALPKLSFWDTLAQSILTGLVGHYAQKEASSDKFGGMLPVIVPLAEQPLLQSIQQLHVHVHHHSHHAPQIVAPAATSVLGQSPALSSVVLPPTAPVPHSGAPTESGTVLSANPTGSMADEINAH